MTRFRFLRKEAGLSLDELASQSGVSKTYLWKLENDRANKIRPSIDILVKIANALSVTLAKLLDLPTAGENGNEAEIPMALHKMRERMKGWDSEPTEQDICDLAKMSLRGKQPRTADEWQQIYTMFMIATATDAS